MRFYSFDGMLSHYAEQTPNAPALLYAAPDRHVCAYAALRERVNRRADALQKQGKTCIGILADGSFDCVVTIFAAVRAGLQVVLLDENLPFELLLEQIASTDVDTLWGDPELCDELAPRLTDGLSPASSGKGRILFFTSGTTERAKAVVLTDRSLMASAYNGGCLLPLLPHDTLLCLLPLHHVFGFVCGLLWGLSFGCCVALGRGPRHYADDCAFFQPTTISAVPLLWGFLLKQRALNRELRLVLLGAGDCSKPLLDAAKPLGIRICFGYGLTETSSGVALGIGDDPYAMTVCPDDTITLAPDGELLIRTPTCMMQGYYGREADTQCVLQNGVLHTGDLGRIDEQGRVYITGRKKEILVLPDGTKLFLPEYEREIAALLGTGELCIVQKNGVPMLVMQGNEGLAAREVLQKLLPALETRPRGQQLKGVLFVSHPLPRTATGKIKRWELQQEVESL